MEEELRLPAVFPQEIRNTLRLVNGEITEIRLRRKAALCVTVMTKEGHLENRESGLVLDDTLFDKTLAALSEYSLYSREETLKEGYFTLQGSLRIGAIGEANCEGGSVKSIKKIHALAIRLWRDHAGSADALYSLLKKSGFQKSLLIYAPPGFAKTTLLRDLAYSLVTRSPSQKVSLIDTRCELLTPRLRGLSHLDVFSGYPKDKGIEMAIRLFSPNYLLCDEIGREEGKAIASLASLGVPAVMTAHAGCIKELVQSPIFRCLHELSYFDYYVGVVSLLKDKPPILSVTTRDEV